MRTACIVKEKEITKTESVVLLRVVGADDDVKFYVAVAVHPGEGRVHFRNAEITTEKSGETVYGIRSMFNGQNRDTLVNASGIAELDSSKLELIDGT